MKWLCQAYRGMDTYRDPVIVEADDSEAAAKAAMAMVPFGDVMQCKEACSTCGGLRRGPDGEVCPTCRGHGA